jgi:hypothetical protein
MTQPSAFELLERIQSYLGNGGLFNPEMMEHDEVSTLIMDCRTYIQQTSLDGPTPKLIPTFITRSTFVIPAKRST